MKNRSKTSEKIVLALPKQLFLKITCSDLWTSALNDIFGSFPNYGTIPFKVMRIQNKQERFMLNV